MINLKITNRLLKIILLLSCALLMSLAVIDNIFAYDINFEYIQHIMSMDTTFKHPHITWRAVQNPVIHHLCYILIILLEAVASVLLWMGVIYLLKYIKSDSVQFQSAKEWGILGLLWTIGLYSLVFTTIASQWFASWQSSSWNAKSAAMPFIILLGITYLILAKKEDADL